MTDLTQSFTPDERERYARHFRLPQVGVAGQQRLQQGQVLLVGAGGLGSPMALYLAAAGVGTIGLVDFDTVDKSNLQRQILHGTSTIGVSKLASAKARLQDLNPHVELKLFEERLTSQNARQILSQFDVVCDGADNFPTRYLVNDACGLTQTPLVSGSIYGFEGQLSVFHYNDGPCYRCLYPEPPPPGTVPSCAEGGVFGVLPGVVGSLQAAEVIKILLQLGDVASGKLVLYDALATSMTSLQFAKNPQCALCGSAPSITELIDYEQFCGLQAQPPAVPECQPAELRQQLAAVQQGRVQLLDVREDWERATAHIELSQHIPLADLADRLAELDPHKPLYVYCASGVRSQQAGKLLTEHNFTGVTSLKGGIKAWRKAL